MYLFIKWKNVPASQPWYPWWAWWTSCEYMLWHCVLKANLLWLQLDASQLSSFERWCCLPTLETKVVSTCASVQHNYMNMVPASLDHHTRQIPLLHATQNLLKTLVTVSSLSSGTIYRSSSAFLSTLFPNLAPSHEASHGGSPGSLAPYIWPCRTYSGRIRVGDMKSYYLDETPSASHSPSKMFHRPLEIMVSWLPIASYFILTHLQMIHQCPFFVSTTPSMPTNFTVHFSVKTVSRSLARCFFIINWSGRSALCCVPRSFVCYCAYRWANTEFIQGPFTCLVFIITTVLGARVMLYDFRLASRASKIMDFLNINWQGWSFAFPDTFRCFLLRGVLMFWRARVIAAIRLFITDCGSFSFRILWRLGGSLTRAFLSRIPCLRASESFCSCCPLVWRLPWIRHCELEGWWSKRRERVWFFSRQPFNLRQYAKYAWWQTCCIIPISPVLY